MPHVVDHLVSCVADLDHNPYPWDSVSGGRHPGHGTANRIIPLGDAYIELVAVVDPDEARDSLFGKWVLDHSRAGGVDALCLRTTSIEQMNPVSMSRQRPDGVLISWRLAGLDRALTQNVPFFIQWDDMSSHPATDDLNDGARIETVTFSGDKARLLSLTGVVPGIVYVDGPPKIEFTTTALPPADSSST